MPDKKLTDSEIVKALECCTDYKNTKCKGCPLEESCVDNNICELALDLIVDKEYYKKNRDKYQENVMFLSKQCDELQAENERLKKSNEMFADIGKMYSEVKAEAYKEVFEKINEKDEVRKIKIFGGLHILKVVLLHDINELKHELVGEDNA